MTPPALAKAGVPGPSVFAIRGQQRHESGAFHLQRALVGCARPLAGSLVGSESGQGDKRSGEGTPSPKPAPCAATSNKSIRARRLLLSSCLLLSLIRVHSSRLASYTQNPSTGSFFLLSYSP